MRQLDAMVVGGNVKALLVGGARSAEQRRLLSARGSHALTSLSILRFCLEVTTRLLLRIIQTDAVAARAHRSWKAQNAAASSAWAALLPPLVPSSQLA